MVESGCVLMTRRLKRSVVPDERRVLSGGGIRAPWIWCPSLAAEPMKRRSLVSVGACVCVPFEAGLNLFRSRDIRRRSVHLEGPVNLKSIIIIIKAQRRNVRNQNKCTPAGHIGPSVQGTDTRWAREMVGLSLRTWQAVYLPDCESGYDG